MKCFDRLVERRISEAETILNYPLPVTWDVGPYKHFRSRRGFGVTFAGHGNTGWDTCHIRLAKKLQRQPVHRVDGVVRHEIGHVVDSVVPPKALAAWSRDRGVRLPSQRHSERRADAIAHAIWQEPILYDRQEVQSTRVGTWPRPAYLGL